jgi:hypothetical protein
MEQRPSEELSVEEISDELADQWEAMIEEAERELNEVRTRLQKDQPEKESVK